MNKDMTIEIIIDAKGNVSGEVHNGPGGDVCLAKLDEILAGVGTRKLKGKDEFHAERGVAQVVRH